jgi:hypothetical protein
MNGVLSPSGRFFSFLVLLFPLLGLSTARLFGETTKLTKNR